jgi:hypothetical protein
MHLEGSCHCGAVKFSLECAEPWPYQRCYCSICRKTGGSGGYMINLGGDARTLKVEGEEHVRTYHAMLDRGGKRVQSRHGRRFCVKCGSHLWAAHERWPDLVHPVASAIDTPLPIPPANVHMMVGSKAPWVRIEGEPDDERFDEYPDKSLAQWHADHGWSDRR